MQSMSVYLRDRCYFFTPSLKSNIGIWYDSPIHVKEDAEIDNDLLGKRILDLLEFSISTPEVEGVPDIDQSSLFRFADTKSKREFYKGVLLCAIEQDGRTISFNSFRAVNSQGVFEGIPGDAPIVIPSDSPPDAMGRALRDAMAKSRPYEGKPTRKH